MENYLAFDIGASGGRAIIGSLKDHTVSIKEIHHFYNGMTLLHGRYHWNIFRIFEEIKKGLKSAVEQNEEPSSMGIDTWGVDYGLLDKAGHILEIPYAYRDHRTDTAIDEVFRLIPKERLYELTGIQFLQFNTIFQLYASIRDKLPIMDIAKDLLFIPDLLNYLLTGIKFSEFSFATTSQLYNPRKKTWDTDVFEAIGADIEIVDASLAPVPGSYHPLIGNLRGINQHSKKGVRTYQPVKGVSLGIIAMGTPHVHVTTPDQRIVSQVVQAVAI